MSLSNRATASEMPTCLAVSRTAEPASPPITIATQEAAPSTALGLPQREIQRAYHKHRDNELTQLMLARNMLRDAALIAALEGCGVDVLVPWECETKVSCRCAIGCTSFLSARILQSGAHALGVTERMRRRIEQSSGPVSLSPFPSWRDCIINGSGYDFRKGAI